MIRRLVAPLLALAAIPALGALAARPPARIAYVSMQRVSAQSTAAQRLTRELSAARDEKARAITEKQKQLEATRLELANAGGLFKATRRAALQTAAEQQANDLRKLRDASQAELAALQRKLEGEFRTEVQATLAAIAAERDADLVLNADSAVVWSRPGADATEEVVRRLNAPPAGR